MISALLNGKRLDAAQSDVVNIFVTPAAGKSMKPVWRKGAARTPLTMRGFLIAPRGDAPRRRA